MIHIVRLVLAAMIVAFHALAVSAQVRFAPVVPSPPSAPVPILHSPNMSLNNPLSFSPVMAPSLYSPSVALTPAPILSISVAPISAAAASDPKPLPAANPKLLALPVAPTPDTPALSALFDGAAPKADSVSSPVPSIPAAPRGSGIRMARAEHEPWLKSVVDLLEITRTGRRVLRDIDALALRRGVPILLDVKPIGNNGEFRYDSDLLIMDSGHLKRDPYQSAPILAHELQHVLQRALEIPTDALELEIESYTVESRVWTELGVEPDAGTFARDARTRLTKDLPGFVKWLGEKYKNNIPLYGSTMDAYVARLEKNLVTAKKAEKTTQRKIAAVKRVLESMFANGMSEEAIAAHAREDLEPLERSLRDGAVNRGWIELDLLRLYEPANRASFRAYARGVIRRARSLSRS